MTLALCGDVMLGRGVDQILEHPGDPELRESHLQDARSYVRLAEEAHGPVPRPAGPSWPWGEALRALAEHAPDVRVVNLETSVTRSDDFAPRKAVHYRMSPANLPCLAAARPDVCALANNHVLDFGRRGLAGTLDALAGAGLTAAGAGRDAAAAWRPAAIPVHGGAGRVLVFSCGMPCSGIPPGWAAGEGRPGVALLPGPTPEAAEAVAGRVRRAKRPGDVAVVSVHWGSNWGYDVPEAHVRFAHALIDGGADLVHGHSSHHPRPLEVHRGRLVLYGCGDFVDDYEGIGGHERFRDDLRLLYLVSLSADGERDGGALTGLRMVPLRARRLRLEAAPEEDADWLAATLDRVGRGFGVRIAREPGGPLVLAGREEGAARAPG
ncbi:CapA family protein [Streptomyces sp. JJ36]|uniref:CapA family protein n=1 Tax=Streptomyces sp. JJ36 TaxID=2736645 RepID=UPI0027E48C5A|nr:CapA family protein [Streptomyces sp. JJ36]MCF6525627.1 CapA family protein [Streptomyces sp. JJ36]